MITHLIKNNFYLFNIILLYNIFFLRLIFKNMKNFTNQVYFNDFLKPIIIFSIITQNFYTQNNGCTELAKLNYKKVYNLIEKANNYAQKGKYKNEKKSALKAVKYTNKIQKKYNCFSPIAYWKLTDAYLHLNEFSMALKNAVKAYQLCESLFNNEEDCNNLSLSKMKIGNVYLSMNKDSLAIEEYLKGIEICKKNSILLKTFINLKIAEIEVNNKNYLKAQDIINESMEVVNIIGPNYDICQVILGRSYFLKGLILFQMGKCEESLNAFLSSIQLSESVFDNNILAKSTFYVGRIYHNNSNFEDALKYYNESVELSKKLNFTDLLINLYKFKSEIEFYLGNYKTCFISIDNSLKLSKDLNNERNEVDCYNYKAFYYGELENFNELFNLSKSALGKAKEINYFEGVSESYNNLATYYEAKKDLQTAKEYAIKNYIISDSLNYILCKVDALNDLGDFCFNKGIIDSAYYFYNQALNLSKNGYYTSCGKYVAGQIDSYVKLGNVFRRKNKKDKAYECYFHALELAKKINYIDGIINASNGIRMTKGLKPIKIDKKKMSRKNLNKNFINIEIK